MDLPQNDSELEEYKKYVTQELSRRTHEKFMAYTWQDMSEPFKVGLHTREICRLIDEAFENLRQGKSTFLLLKCCFRHGKSHIVSRYLPPHFLGEFPDSNVMVVGYNSSLTEGFSKDARNIFRSEEYRELYPDISISRENAGVQEWQVQGRLGKFYASGLSSGITGKGYTLGICDDYCSSRAEAESEVMRNSTWEHFTNDFLTRRSPVSITIVLATPWHVDDVIGRIEQKLDPNSDHYDPKFPKFRVISFPAMNGEVEVYNKKTKQMEIKKYETLFPERFDRDWYESQFASLGEYSAMSLMQCSPQMRGGNYLKLDKIKWHDDEREFPKGKYARIWDLAHSAKQKLKDDPDFTSGTLLMFRLNSEKNWELWIKHVSRFREETTVRDDLIRATTDKDGQSVEVGIENSLDSKDSYATLKRILSGKRIVKLIPVLGAGDKVARISPVEPIFEAGNVHVLRGDWNADWLTELRAFPSGKHDDQVDNISAGWIHFQKKTGTIETSRTNW